LTADRQVLFKALPDVSGGTFLCAYGMQVAGVLGANHKGRGEYAKVRKGLSDSGFRELWTVLNGVFWIVAFV
jgi:hypothetical protein